MNYVKPKYLDIPFYMRANILHKECNKSRESREKSAGSFQNNFPQNWILLFVNLKLSWVVLKKKPNNIKVRDIATFPTCGNDPEPEVVEGDVHPVHPKIRWLVELSG